MFRKVSIQTNGRMFSIRKFTEKVLKIKKDTHFLVRNCLAIGH